MIPPRSSPPSSGPISLPSLSEISFVDHRDTSPLFPDQTASLEKLAALWAIIARQVNTLVERNQKALEPLTSDTRAELDRKVPPFEGPWAAYSQITKTLEDVRSSAVTEGRSIFNGLYELTHLASLLASYGSPSFLLRAYQQAIAAADPTRETHHHIKRLYTHPLLLSALNIQLSSIGGSPISRSSLPTGKEGTRALEGLSRECHLLKSAHTKEAIIIQRIKDFVAADSPSVRRLIIITAPDETSLLVVRLRHKLPENSKNFRTEPPDNEAPLPDIAQRIFVCSVRQAHLFTSEEYTSVVLHSPLFIEKAKINPLSPAALSHLQALFRNGHISILQTTSELFTLDEKVSQLCLASSPQAPLSAPSIPKAARPLTPSAQTAGLQSRPQRGSLVVELPRSQQPSLFDQQTLDSLKPPPAPQPILRSLPQIDPDMLPRDVSQLNSMLGIANIKSALIPRADQTQELLRMIASDSFNWLYKSPTGSGKTAFASMVMAVRLGNSPATPQMCRRGFRIGYATPNVDLCPQAKEEFLRFIDLQDSDVAILNGKTPTTRRREIVSNGSNKILVGTPGTLRTTLNTAPPGSGYESLALLVIDEFQTAEGEHEMSRLIREARATGVPILALSGTPVRDEEDLSEKQALLPAHEGSLVPLIPQPLKNHSLVASSITPQLATLLRELSDFALIPYIDGREQLLNGRTFFNQAEGRETATLFENRQKLQRKPHIKSFSAPTAHRVNELKAELQELREDIKSALERRKKAGLPVGEFLSRASKETANASINLGRIGSVNAAIAPLSSGGRFPFLYDFADTWFPHMLESPRRAGTLPIIQNFVKSPDYRGIIRQIAAGTPFYHLLQATSGRDALQRAFTIPDSLIPMDPQDRKQLFLGLATHQMSQNSGIENQKEGQLFEHIEERLANKEARGILIFAEPRYLTRYLALRLHHRFHARGVHVAFVSGEGDGFAADLANSLTALQAEPDVPQKKHLSSFKAIRDAFEAPTEGAHRRTDIIVATSRLAVGHNLSAAAEAHLYTMHADAQKLLQTIGRAGRPKGDNFFGRVGQCFYHVTQNTFERYLFLSAINKYSWMKSNLTKSESWREREHPDPE